jgi:hypothetical protein
LIGGVVSSINTMQNEKHEWVEAHGIPREIPAHEPPMDYFIWQEDEPIVPTNEEEGEFDEVF